MEDTNISEITSTEKEITRAANIIKTRKRCVALTGAGISVESGIPPFRSKGGLWEKYDPTVYASIDVFRKDPSKYWTIRGEFIRNYNNYQPNPGHLALMELETMGLLRCVITQNIDGLHAKSGSKDILEIHGSLREIYCVNCKRQYIAPDIPAGTPPYCESCGGVLKPNTVLFGESLPATALKRAQEESEECGVMLVIGTSANVFPAAALPEIAHRSGAVLVEINLENAFPQAEVYINEKSGIALPEIIRRIKDII